MRSGRNGVPVTVVNAYLASAHRVPAAARSARCRSLCSRSAVMVVLSSAMTRRPASLFGGPAISRPAELLQLPRHGQGPGIEVEVAPPQADGLAAAQPAQRDEVEQRVQAVTAHLGQELRGLGGGPHSDGRPPALELPAPASRPAAGAGRPWAAPGSGPGSR
jgi:hypothetical protein